MTTGTLLAIEAASVMTEKLPRCIAAELLAAGDGSSSQTVIVRDLDDENNIIAQFGNVADGHSVNNALLFVTAITFCRNVHDNYRRMRSALVLLSEKAQADGDTSTARLIAEALADSYDTDPAKADKDLCVSGLFCRPQ